jgi:acid phosphatase (class A)
MKLRHSIIALSLMLLSACGGTDYPYPPQFVSPVEVPAQSIPAPPAKGSAQYNKEIDGIIALQSKLTEKDYAPAQMQDVIIPQKMVQPVLGQQFDPEHYPALYTLLKHAGSDAWRISDATEEYWKSPRPWYADDRVQLHVTPIYQYGYPSGHTVTFRVWAHVLADLMPSKREAFFKQAWNTGHNRIVAGVHFPHDIEGGKKLAAAIYEKMHQQPQFQREFEAAKAELRGH